MWRHDEASLDAIAHADALSLRTARAKKHEGRRIHSAPREYWN